MSDETSHVELSQEEINFLNSIFDLAREGKATALESLLAQGIPADLTDAKGNTLLILAAYHQHPELVKLLLNREASIDSLNDRGQTALICAVFRDNQEIAQLLIEAGANLNIGFQKPLEVAEFFGLENMKKYLQNQ